MDVVLTAEQQQPQPAKDADITPQYLELLIPPNHVFHSCKGKNLEQVHLIYNCLQTHQEKNLESEIFYVKKFLLGIVKMIK